MVDRVFPEWDWASEGAGEVALSLTQSLRKWAESEVIVKRLEYKEDYELLLLPAMKKLFVDIEMQKLIWPERYGGAEHNRSDVIFILLQALEEIGRADAGIGWITAATFALSSSFALESNMNEGLCEVYGTLSCRAAGPVTGALVLPLYGLRDCDPSREYRGRYLQARAKKEGDRWVLSGEKIRPFNAGMDAAYFGVLSHLEGEKEPGFIIVPAAAEGVARAGDALKTTGLAASRNAELSFEQVTVPAGNLVFRGSPAYREMLSWLYAGIGAVALGSLFASFEIIKEWGDTRVIKGKGNIFKNNPLTAALMAEVSHEILLCRLLIQRLAQLFARDGAEGKGEGEGLYIASLSSAAHITGAAEKAINKIMELMGSAGYATEWNLERYWRDLKTMQVHLGNWELNKMELAQYFYGSQNLQDRGV